LGSFFALGALALKPGEKVILPSFTFVATAQRSFTRALPLFADIDDDLNISVSDLDRLLNENPDVGGSLRFTCMATSPGREIERVVALCVGAARR